VVSAIGNAFASRCGVRSGAARLYAHSHL
jgi:hypothetical protein